MRLLAGIACAAFVVVSLLLLFLLLLSGVDFENVPSPSTGARVVVGVLALAFLVAAVLAGRYAHVPTQQRGRRALIFGTVAVMALVLWLSIG
jgi:hypothetical protein